VEVMRGELTLWSTRDDECCDRAVIMRWTHGKKISAPQLWYWLPRYFTASTKHS